MSRNTLIILFLCLVGYSFATTLEVKEEWSKFLLKHGKSYASPEEYEKRFNIFQDTINEINVINSDPTKTWTAGVNQFADMTWEEFQTHYNLKADQSCSATNTKSPKFDTAAIPKSFDWREKGVVTSVKDQKKCGSCWTFSISASMESAHAIKTGQLYDLAPQQLVDCAGAFGNHGCHGGVPSSGMEYLAYAGGQLKWSDYPYYAEDRPCTANLTLAVARTLGSYNITAYDEDALVASVYMYNPVSVAFQVVSDFRLYKSGVYSSTACKGSAQTVNHAVLSVGFGETADGKKYHIIKNSWSESFGMQGYFLIERGNNMCGIASCCSFPIVAP